VIDEPALQLHLAVGVRCLLFGDPIIREKPVDDRCSVDLEYDSLARRSVAKQGNSGSLERVVKGVEIRISWTRRSPCTAVENVQERELIHYPCVPKVAVCQLIVIPLCLWMSVDKIRIR
jgi:hypothetical protein